MRRVSTRNRGCVRTDGLYKKNNENYAGDFLQITSFVRAKPTELVLGHLRPQFYACYRHFSDTSGPVGGFLVPGLTNHDSFLATAQIISL